MFDGSWEGRQASDCITEKQREFIEDIEEFTGRKFEGKTREDAAKYIDKNIELYKINITSNWALEHGYF